MLDMTLTLIGLYDWDNRLFDQMRLPEGYDRDEVVSNILMELGELEVIYPSWDAMRAAIGMWSRTMLWTWERRYIVSHTEYAPLENLKRETIQSEQTSGEHKTDGTHSEDETRDLSRGVVANTKASSSGDSSSTNWRNGFNDGRTDSDGGDTEASSSGTTDSTENTTEKETWGRNGTTGETGNESGSRDFTEQTHGSIGVITSQTMFQQEWEVAEHNLVRNLVEDFKARFCIMVY